ncbi:MAG: aspartate--tRNA(Asn) ligase [Spirochaetota bacterium]
MRVLAAAIPSYVDKEVRICGWIHRIRELGGISFVLVRDRSGVVQTVFEGKAPGTPESVVCIDGTVRANEKAPGGFEVQAAATEILAEAAADLPIPVNQDLEGTSLDAILDNRMISLRNPRIRDVFRVQSGIIEHFGAYLRSLDFVEIKTSKLIGTGTEGGTGLFTVEYFDDKVFLAQSPQFYKQAMVASGLERVFEVAPAYRAEKHDTPRHLNEYVSLDVEMGFIESEGDLMDLEVGILQAVFAGLREDCGSVLDEFGADLPTSEALAATPRIDHDEAKEIVSKRGGKKVFEINPEGERLLCEWAVENHGVDAVFVYGFPRRKRPFYTYPAGNKTMSFDLLFRGLEITTGGRRINEYPMMLEALPKFGLTEEALADYVSIFKYGCPPHGGFAIGLERLTQKILGLANVKEASLFPRDRRRTRP